jgi:hypothetical protein
LLTKVTLPLIITANVLFLVPSGVAAAQQSTVSAGLSRLAGTDDSSHIEYVRLFLRGTSLTSTGSSTHASVSPSAQAGTTVTAETLSSGAAASGSSADPTLIAQCTRGASGKLGFELLANFGGVEDLAYYPPWRPTSGGELFPPQPQKANITMDFLGYTKVKPVKRQWEVLMKPVGQYRYNPPSGGSANMEDSTYYLRFLLALPTLHLTLGDKAAEFRTTPFLDQIRKEPLCKASLL